MVAGANRARVVGIGGVEVVRIAEQGSVSERGIIVSGRGRVSGVGHGGTYSGVREGGGGNVSCERRGWDVAMVPVGRVCYKGCWIDQGG